MTETTNPERVRLPKRIKGIILEHAMDGDGIDREALAYPRPTEGREFENPYVYVPGQRSQAAAA